MTREEIEREYTVNAHGVIQNLGKFQGEMLYAVYFYDLMLNGMGDETLSDGSELFELSEDDFEMFPEIDSHDRYLVLTENDQGFVSVETFENDPREEEEEEEEEEEVCTVCGIATALACSDCQSAAYLCANCPCPTCNPTKEN